jgi:hypothetical protein
VVTIKERRPTRIVETCHDGFHSLGWKSENEKQRRVFVWKRPFVKTVFERDIPEGVIIVTAGGLKGYSGGNFSVPVVFSIVIIMISTHVLSAYA